MVQVKKVEVKQAIENAACRLFMEKGYTNTSVPQIAKAAGVSPANIYVYFRSKLDILTAIYEGWFDLRLEELEKSLGRCRSARQRLYKIFETMWVDIPTADNGFCNNLIQALSTNPVKEDYQPTLRLSIEHRLERMLAGCLGEFDAERHRMITHIVLMAFDGYALNVHLNGGQTATSRDIELFCEMVLKSV